MDPFMDLVMVKEAMMDILGGSGDYGLQKSTSNERLGNVQETVEGP